MVIQDMPSMTPNEFHPSGEQQDEFERQLAVMINEHKSYPSIVTWVGHVFEVSAAEARASCRTLTCASLSWLGYL